MNFNQQRLVSLDAMRGFVMFLRLGGGEIGHAGFLSELLAALEHPWSQTLYHQLQYSGWTMCSSGEAATCCWFPPRPPPLRVSESTRRYVQFPRNAAGVAAFRFVRVEAFAYPSTHLGGRRLTPEALSAMNVHEISRLHDR